MSEPPPGGGVNMGAYLLDSGGASFTLYDGGNGPSPVACAQYWDGTSNLVTFLYNDLSTGCFLVDFDMDARTWGVPYATGNQPTVSYLPVALWRYADGVSFIGLFLRGGDNIFYYCSIFDGSNWDAPFDICTNAAGVDPDVSFDTATSILDSSDQLAVIFHDSPNNRFFWQQVASDSSLTNFGEFPGQAGSPQDLSDNPTASTMRIVGGSILWGIRRNAVDPDAGPYEFPAVYIGTPVSNPVWTETGTIDPNSFVLVDGDPIPQPQSATSYGDLFYVGGVLYSIYMRNVYTNDSFPSQDGQIFISQTSDPSFLAGWTSQNFYNPNADPTLFPPGDDALGFTPLLGFNAAGAIIGASVDYTDTTVSGPEQRYWIGGTPSPPAPSGVVTALLSGGSTGARFKPCVRPGNEYFAGQLAEKVRLARINKGEWPYRHLFPAGIDIVVNRIGSIPIPAPNMQTTVLQYRVPSGFRFWMDAILEDGPDIFSPGDAIWNVDINAQVPTSPQATKVQGLVNIPVKLGSWLSGETWLFDMPYVFAPLTVIRSRVTNVNFGAGADFFTSGFFGFLVPVERGQN